MKQKLAIILILISFKSFACDCPVKKLSDLQKYEMENSECIFIGEVIEVNNSDLSFKIKVIESLDGEDNKGNVYVGKNWKYCEPSIEKKGKWIVYGKMENGFLRLNTCGISRSFDNPMVNFLPPSPELYEKLTTENEKQNIIKKIRAESMKIALSDLDLEIIALRKRRDKKIKASR
ncbi:hypothetical protein [Algibacter lectus]|uniref:Uncharacterized protein n=1 Tax=Algibacter lectus TaxID=221126 RepID=A0A4R8M6E2_9FLAO|nr:hypothetical protein [Algibacter lectus]MWW25642.1 hypothetical protein [Algibacter lectus]TDY60923.1 hypothetical protein DFQ06_2930 [Algibacter lectus]